MAGDSFVLGMLLMYHIAGVYVGLMLRAKRPLLAVIVCALVWPIMLADGIKR